MTTLRNITLVLVCFAGAAHAKEGSCERSGALQFVCGPTNAEDLVLVPGTRWIIASALIEGGGLYLIDSHGGTWSRLQPGAKHDAALPDCTTPPSATATITHGLNLRTGAGHSTLYVVGHGAREAIEVFDVEADGERPVLTWKGCVLMPRGLAANSVASLADGSLVATVPLMHGKTFSDALGGDTTGAVFEWSPGKPGFEVMRGTELPYNNGIEASADGREIFVASSGARTIVAFSNSDPATRLGATRLLPFTPDNVHMGSDGLLYTAGMKSDEPGCGGPPGRQTDFETLRTCPRGTFAMTIDPATMKDAVVVETPVIPGFSDATMVLPIGDQFWIGTFSGDRVAHGTLR